MNYVLMDTKRFPDKEAVKAQRDDLIRADLSRMDLSRIELRGANLSYADLDRKSTRLNSSHT